MVTVLMSVFNTPRPQLMRAVVSIFEQAHADFEFLILDDGSTSEETVACLDKLDDPRIRLFHEPHRGLTRTLNLGLKLAQGGLIARQDADDWSHPRRLSRQVAFLATHPDHVLVGSCAWMHQQDGTELWPGFMPDTHERIVRMLPGGNTFFHGATMFRRDAAERAGGYREALPCSQDYDFFWRLTEIGRAANLAEPLYNYRYGASSVSATRAAEQAVSHRATRILASDRKAGRPENLEAALEEAAHSCDTLRAALRQADHLTLAGAYSQAGKAYRSLLMSHPASALAWGKLLRLGLFLAVPPIRERLFV